MPNVVRDARAKPIGRALLSVENQQRVFKTFEEDVKLTVGDAVELVRKQTPEGERPLNERTIRRAINSLVINGFLVEAGRTKSGATLYSKQSTKLSDDTNIVPFGGQLVSVEHFFRLLTDDNDPFKLKMRTDVLTPEIVMALRKMFVFVVMSSSNPGMSDALQKQNKNLHAVANELRHALNLIDGLLDSPIWFEQYRERMGYLIRRTQQNNPELYQLAVDVIKGGE